MYPDCLGKGWLDPLKWSHSSITIWVISLKKTISIWHSVVWVAETNENPRAAPNLVLDVVFVLYCTPLWNQLIIGS